MKQHLLVTPEMKEVMPESIEVLFTAGTIYVCFEDIDDMEGENMLLEGDQDVFVEWLKPFDGIAVGNGVPQLEQFSIMHIKDDV